MGRDITQNLFPLKFHHNLSMGCVGFYYRITRASYHSFLLFSLLPRFHGISVAIKFGIFLLTHGVSFASCNTHNNLNHVLLVVTCFFPRFPSCSVGMVAK
jgi:hypothetical protein